MTFITKLIIMTQMAMTPNFAWITTDDTESDFLEYRQWEQEEVIKAETLERFECTDIHGYSWTTIVCRTDKIYDIYRVFDKNWNIIAESEDEVISLPFLLDTKHITIKAYEKLSENRLLQLAESGYPVKFITFSDRCKSDSYKLSVVVPLYKAENFMSRTIDAILSSSLDSIQLILVNDGSPDNSLQIAKRYADNYSCVSVLTKTNSWASESRNLWLSIAEWEYTAFCDSDDIPHPYMYEKLYQTCKKQWTDVAIWSVLIKNLPWWIREWFMKIWKDVVYTYEEMMKMRETKENIFFVAVWNKIMKTDVARLEKSPTEYAGKRFPYEDIAYTWSIYSYIDKFAYCDGAIYTRDKRKRKTEWTISTRENGETVRYMWEAWLFASTYPLYHKSWKNLMWHDYRHFKRVASWFAKIQWDLYLENYRLNELRKLVMSQRLYENKLILEDKELSSILARLK